MLGVFYVILKQPLIKKQGWNYLRGVYENKCANQPCYDKYKMN